MLIHVTKMIIRAMITITQDNISRVINMQIIYLNQHQSNEKTLIQLQESINALQMAKMTTSVLNLSVLRLSDGMGEYSSPSIKS